MMSVAYSNVDHDAMLEGTDPTHAVLQLRQ